MALHVNTTRLHDAQHESAWKAKTVNVRTWLVLKDELITEYHWLTQWPCHMAVRSIENECLSVCQIAAVSIAMHWT